MYVNTSIIIITTLSRCYLVVYHLFWSTEVSLWAMTRSRNSVYRLLDIHGERRCKASSRHLIIVSYVIIRVAVPLLLRCGFVCPIILRKKCDTSGKGIFFPYGHLHEGRVPFHRDVEQQFSRFQKRTRKPRKKGKKAYGPS